MLLGDPGFPVSLFFVKRNLNHIVLHNCFVLFNARQEKFRLWFQNPGIPLASTRKDRVGLCCKALMCRQISMCFICLQPGFNKLKLNHDDEDFMVDTVVVDAHACPVCFW